MNDNPERRQKMKIILIGLPLAIILFLVIFYARYGGFRTVAVTVAQTGGETLVYDEIRGEYRQSGGVMDRIYYSLLNDRGIETYKGFGLYYDNPRKVEKENLRSEAGCVLEEKDFEQLPLLKEQYRVRDFPVREYITAEFPYRGKMSVMFSLMKVYPALNRFADEKGYETDSFVMEIYDVPGGKISYRKELIPRS